MAKFSMSSMPSKRLIASYVFDWICLAAIAAIGAAFNAPGPYKRPFSLVDLSISFPYIDESISTVVLVVVTLFAPAVLIFLVAFIFVPGPTVVPGTPKSLIWKKKFWEWHAGWLGLAMSYALAFFFTQGMKNIFGRTRPDLLARCDPDLENFRDHVVGNYARGFNPEWVLVSPSICRQTDSHVLNDGFRSFPSGHSSSSWAGLLYLTLFFCSKFSISIPYLAPRAYSAANKEAAVEKASTLHGSILPLHNSSSTAGTTSKRDLSPSPSATDIIPLRNQAAAPPTFLLAFPILFISVAIYICSTRYSEYYHHGIDIVTGSLIGIISSWVGFRWYHLPAGRGAGWAWGARSRDRAFGIGVGRGVYVGLEGWGSKKSRARGAEATEMENLGRGEYQGEYQGQGVGRGEYQNEGMGRSDYQTNGHMGRAV